MNHSALTTRLIIDGFVVIPDVVAGSEMEGMRDAFERRVRELGKRWMSWEEICLVPELVAYIAHPRLMELVNAFTAHFGQEAVFANSPGARDVFDPNKPPAPFDPKDLKNGPLGWHDDVMGMRNPRAGFLQTALSSLLYLDDTFAESGAYCSAVGSHHLAHATSDDKPVVAPAKEVLEHCELRPLPVKAGTVILYRSHHWHGVIPPRQRRRLMLQTFCAKSLYNLQEGHTQLSEATVALMPAERRRSLCFYSKT